MNLVENTIPESPLQQIQDALLTKHGVRLSIKRDDLLHPIIHGNKWRKLKYNLVAFAHSGKSELLTFGGAFSNHLYASAAAGKIFRLSTRAIVRGPQLDQRNPTLRFAKACGMQLHPVTRIEYRQRNSPEYLEQLQQRFTKAFILPEGGTNAAALKGVAELANSLPEHQFLVCATGSGGTLAGLLSGQTQTQVMGIAVLKNAEYLKTQIAKLQPSPNCDWRLLCDHHDAGYGRFSPELWRFCQWFERTHKVPLEPIYSGKMLYALWQLIEQDYFPSGSHIIAIHTGGLQGKDGLRYRGLIGTN
ncbi:pyridoxal-phosphate dependent enzyme [Pseudoalteromonas sp. BDTF-M6]|uniref:1-aminocyclopropane-1-carboxylate deaminase/D-cysteine desulfhydrase n=1 Tax=Pseudoalteromonas sp. BDTF-M6 TaxID=2796132 RepID=UPI001BB06386|nr:pyridoxal-phosphate dependent enzyme [Pseudoalteromonas sp. BDTF-M6]MBS3797254.1 1-aminocyclopropane-1-carboxylate deaminase/D-cysteine desulfhydrase [Pseudoalteromonas sp. BDTF-M6]